MIFLGLASNYHARDIWRHSFAHGNKKDYVTLEAELAKRYGSDLARTSLIFSGRSAIALALKSFLASGKLQRRYLTLLLCFFLPLCFLLFLELS